MNKQTKKWKSEREREIIISLIYYYEWLVIGWLEVTRSDLSIISKANKNVFANEKTTFVGMMADANNMLMMFIGIRSGSSFRPFKDS